MQTESNDGINQYGRHDSRSSSHLLVDIQFFLLHPEPDGMN